MQTTHQCPRDMAIYGCMAPERSGEKLQKDRNAPVLVVPCKVGRSVRILANYASRRFTKIYKSADLRIYRVGKSTMKSNRIIYARRQSKKYGTIVRKIYSCIAISCSCKSRIVQVISDNLAFSSSPSLRRTIIRHFDRRDKR